MHKIIVVKAVCLSLENNILNTTHPTNVKIVYFEFPRDSLNTNDVRLMPSCQH